ncbi:hypothetical protein J0H58_35240 [bacterium]|nr:hypothetical protein [bacterium]
MTTTVVLCRCDARRPELIETVRRTPFSRVDAFPGPDLPAGGAETAPPDLVVLGTSGLPTVADVVPAYRAVRDVWPGTPVVVELGEDHDDVDLAFTLIHLGAHDVVHRRHRAEDFWRVAEIAAGRREECPYQPLLLPHPSTDGLWAFVSMDFDPNVEERRAYYTAVRPAICKALGLPPTACQRADEVYPPDGELDFVRRAKQAIYDRAVVIAFLCSPDERTPPNSDVCVETGYAQAHGKPVLVLRTRASQRPPVMLGQTLWVDYSSLCELALKLYYGLGGNRGHLVQTWPG